MNNKNENNYNNETFLILIDMSYFIFYRYYALINWWKIAKPDDELGNPIDNIEFVNKYRKTFINKLFEIPKKLKIKKYEFICAKDCSRKNIWRNSLYSQYKENRIHDDDFLGGPFFKLSYELVSELNLKILYHNNLEADDCIALFIKKFKNNYNKILVIANDMDYLQLHTDNIKIMNLKYNYLNENKKWSGESSKDLFIKVVMGDKSDNINSIFKKCGLKTAIKCYNDYEFFKNKLEKENCNDKYQLNLNLIDFNYIPEKLINEFYINLN